MTTTRYAIQTTEALIAGVLHTWPASAKTWARRGDAEKAARKVYTTKLGHLGSACASMRTALRVCVVEVMS